ncbi:unnamed protein product [Pedinophyceae sp. YPF-701]|nr:unnamed protein product [Pedinophyceae sp. YPF-701]
MSCHFAPPGAAVPVASRSTQAPEPAAAAEPAAATPAPRLVCPICLNEEFDITDLKTSGLNCGRCSRTFESADAYADLTITSGRMPKLYEENRAVGTELFRSPLISFVYERGWRQGFSWAGFPGLEKETRMALKRLEPASGGLLLDVSCGSGLFTREFLRSGQFGEVIASDFSESMLRQTRQFLEEDPKLKGVAKNVRLIRADVARLPFATGSLDGVHAGAAIHCWPEPVSAAAEISRVLKPGGVFVGSTFLSFTAPIGQIVGDEAMRPFERAAAMYKSTGAPSMPYRWWMQDELEEVFSAAGLEKFECVRDNRFIMWSVRKPE